MATKKVIRKEKATLKSRVIYGIVGLVVWSIVSFAFLDIALENFRNKENYLHLGLWLMGIILGYVVVLYMLGVRKKKKEDETADEKSGADTA
tara:strand:+ start:113 stop:388 length:276 start_codon:yes stop_codon:yes gene_type:complete